MLVLYSFHQYANLTRVVILRRGKWQGEENDKVYNFADWWLFNQICHLPLSDSLFAVKCVGSSCYVFFLLLNFSWLHYPTFGSSNSIINVIVDTGLWFLFVIFIYSLTNSSLPPFPHFSLPLSIFSHFTVWKYLLNLNSKLLLPMEINRKVYINGGEIIVYTKGRINKIVQIGRRGSSSHSIDDFLNASNSEVFGFLFIFLLTSTPA